MRWMNEHEIEAAREALAGRPSGRYARFLDEFKDVVNASSDGWPYWKPAGRAAAGLCELIARETDALRTGRTAPTATEADYALSLRPIRAFLTRKGLRAVELAA